MIGARLGAYRVIQLIDEGGFGSVYMAEQHEPVQRLVALKVLKPGMDSRVVAARFEAERQALALMDHPHIARVFDGGVTDLAQGARPYFVMEYVKGDPITQFADARRLTLIDRLLLFIQVCQAVQHAHTKGVIHRDIKPRNVLVNLTDGRPYAKVIDFGIAKATGARLTDSTLFTEQFQLIGTPEYMSPEQAEGSPDIDTRTDVYALGVLLYELLSGATPFDSKRLRGVSPAQMRRIIQEEDAPPPSQRLERGSNSLELRAAARQADPGRLATQIRGELDWIVMKALEKERIDRYESASELAADVQRYLRHEPIVAAPQRWSYRLSKFIRRRRGQALAISAVAASMLIGMVGTIWQARIAARESVRAQAAATRADTKAAEEARRADELRQVAAFQAEMLRQIDVPEAGRQSFADIREKYREALKRHGVGEQELQARGEQFERELALVNVADVARGLIERTMIQPANAAIGERFADQPAVAASLRQTLAELYSALGRAAAAAPLQRAAFETRRRVLGADHPDTLASLDNLGQLLAGLGQFAEGETCLREALERRRRALGPEHPETLATVMNLGALLQAADRRSEAEPYYREALDKFRATLGPADRRTLKAINNMGFFEKRRGDLDAAETYFREALAGCREALGQEDEDTIVALNNLGSVLQAQGKLAEAGPFYAEAYEKCSRKLGEDHPSTLTLCSNVGYLLHAQGRLAEAEPYFRRTLAGRRAILGEDHPDSINALTTLGLLLVDLGQLDEAEESLGAALEKIRRVMGPEHTDTLATMNRMGMLLYSRRRLADAETIFRDVLEKARRVAPPGGNEVLSAANNLGMVLREQGNLSEAEPLLRQVLETRRATLGVEHPDYLASLNNLGALLADLDRPAEAEACFREALERGLTVFGPDHANLVLFSYSLACALDAQGRPDEALGLLVEGEPEARRRFSGAHQTRVADWLRELGRIRGGRDFDPGVFRLAEMNLVEAHGIYVDARGAQSDDAQQCVEWLLQLYDRWESLDPGAGAREKAQAWREKGTAGQ